VGKVTKIFPKYPTTIVWELGSIFTHDLWFESEGSFEK